MSDQTGLYQDGNSIFENVFIQGALNVATTNEKIVVRSNGITIDNNSGTETLRIEPDGRVGIHSNIPAATLDIRDVGSTGPGILISGCTGTEGDLAVQEGQILHVGHFNSDTSNFIERARITTGGNIEIGSIVDPGDTLRFLNVANFNTGSSAGSILRLSTVKSDGSSSTSADIVKYKTGGLVINNNEEIGTAGFISFGTATGGGSVTERLRIASDGVVSWQSGSTPLSGTSNNYSLNIYRDSGTGYGYFDNITNGSNHTGIRIRAYHDGTYNNVFEHNVGDFTRFFTGGDERLRILSSGGITFNGDTATANALDDYEEGSFTPSYNTSNSNIGTVTYDQRSGRYIKVGRLCFITIRLRTDNISSVGSGSVRITGLPFTHVNVANNRAVSNNVFTSNWTSSDSPTQVLIQNNQTVLNLYQKPHNEDTSSLPVSALNPASSGANGNDNDIRLTAMYETST